MDPEVTIGVCVRNSGAYIRYAIDGILNQDFPHELMEIIFVDDGSEDETLAIIENRVSRMDISAKIVHQEWKGLGPARNVVVNNARGKYIVLGDGDTILSKDYVTRQVDYMERNGDVGICYGSFKNPFKANLVLALELVPVLVSSTEECDWREMKKLPGTAGSTYRTRAIREVDGFDDKITGTGEDIDAAYRIQRAGWLIRQTQGVIYETHGFMSTWRDLWVKYFWHGFTSLHLHKSGKRQFSLPRMTPIAGFIAGLLFSKTAYRAVNRKFVFLLPFQFAFKMTAWCLGFIRRQINDA